MLLLSHKALNEELQFDCIDTCDDIWCDRDEVIGTDAEIDTTQQLTNEEILKLEDDIRKSKLANEKICKFHKFSWLGGFEAQIFALKLLCFTDQSVCFAQTQLESRNSN